MELTTGGRGCIMEGKTKPPAGGERNPMSAYTASHILTAAFTGYRPAKMPFTEQVSDPKYLRFRSVEARVLRMLAEQGYMRFVTGLAMGFDTWAAEDVLALKEEFPHIILHCAVPFPEQDAGWSEADRDRRGIICAQADDVVTVSPSYVKDAYFIRNRYMVDMADTVICAYDGRRRGGTAYTVKYAVEQDKHVICINPETGEVKLLGKPMA